jgi:hypothetical protein
MNLFNSSDLSDPYDPFDLSDPSNPSDPSYPLSKDFTGQDLAMFYNLLPNLGIMMEIQLNSSNYKLSKEFHEEVNKWDTFQFGIGRHDNISHIIMEGCFAIDEFCKIIIDKKVRYFSLHNETDIITPYNNTDITEGTILLNSSIEMILYGISQDYFTPYYLICFNNILDRRFLSDPKYNDLKQKFAKCLHDNLIEFEKEPSLITGIPKSLLTLDICRTAFRAAHSFDLDAVQKAIPDEFKELLKPVGTNTKPACNGLIFDNV